MRTTKMICRLQQIDDCRSAETTLSCSWATIHWKPPQPYARAAHHENHGERSALDVVAGRAVRPIFGGQMSILSEFLHNYAPSNGWGTFFTAAFGAFAGAFAASRAHNKRTIVAELNALSAARELSVAIANILLALKRQHVVPLNDNFERIRVSYANHQSMLKAGTQLAPFHFTADLRSLDLPATPQVALEKMIFEKTL